MSKPFTYWVRLALVATLCTLVTFSPVSAGRLMDRLLHRDHCKVAADRCDPAPACETSPAQSPSCLIVPAAPCQPACVSECAPTAVEPTKSCDAAPPCGCDSMATPAVESTPAVQHASPAVEHPAPAAEHPAPVVEHPAPAVEHPAPVVEQPKPAVIQPAPVSEPPKTVETPAPVVKQPDPIVIEPAPVVKQPDPIVETPVKEPEVKKTDVVELPALAPGEPEPPVAPNPFDAAPVKTPDADPFGAAEVKTPVAEAIVDPPALDPPALDPPAIEPAMPAEAPAKNDLEDLFGDPAPAPVVPEKAAPAGNDPKLDDLFNLDADTKPAVPAENAAPEVEPAKPAKPADSELDDLFNLDKPEKPVSQKSSPEMVGKPVTTEVDKSTTPDADSSFLDSLFSNQPAKTDAPSEPAESVKPNGTEETKPTQEKEVDELDALFGVGAFSPPANFQGAEYRLWVDNSGAYQVKARLAVIYVDKVKLLKENGKFTTVPLSRLSEADFGYVSWVASNLTGDQAARMVKTKSDATAPEMDR